MFFQIAADPSENEWGELEKGWEEWNEERAGSDYLEWKDTGRQEASRLTEIRLNSRHKENH